MNRDVEILAPAGSMECLRAAVAAGADAIYLSLIHILCVVLMVIYYVWRMYRYFPDQPPMSYYHYNLLRLLMDVAFGALK